MSAASICHPMANLFFAFCYCHARSAVALVFELLRHIPVRSSSLDDPVRQGAVACYPATCVALLRAMCVEDAYVMELLWKTPTGPLRPMVQLRMGTHRCGFLLASCATFLAILPLHPGSPVLLGSTAPFRSRPSCAEPSFQKFANCERGPCTAGDVQRSPATSDYLFRCSSVEDANRNGRLALASRLVA